MAGGREPNATAMALVQAGTSALAVRWGMGMCPEATQEGHCTDLRAALLWDIPETAEGWADAGSETERGNRWRRTSFRGRGKLGTTDGPSWFCLTQAKI